MKAVRSPLATALVVMVIMLNGCGVLFNSNPGPDAPGFDPPAGTYDTPRWVYIETHRSQLYTTTDAAASALEFKPTLNDDRIFVDDDLTIRAYVIDHAGLRSPIAEAEYIITATDTNAPTIPSPGIHQTNAEYFGYDIQWDAWPANSSDDGEPNPSDDVTDWYNLKFAVYASPADDIDTLEDAESSPTVTLLRDWHSENSAGGVGNVDYTASFAGERRYINVFVRDLEGNVSAYGSVEMESRPALDIYLAQSIPAGPEDDEVWLNPGDGTDSPAFFSAPEPPPAVLKDTYAVALADLNDDGYDDLIACYRDGATDYQGWFAANGNGTFSSTPVYFEEDSDQATDIEIADFNLDGKMDVVFANTSTNVAVYDAESGLLFTVPSVNTDFVAAGDINADGYPDIVTGEMGPEKVQVWINTAGTGVVKALQTSWTGVDDVTDPLDVHLADLDGDGDADLLVASVSRIAQVYYSDGNSTLAVEDESPFWTDQPYRIATADWDGNGWLDLIFANNVAVPPASVDTRIFLSDGAYGFTMLPVVPQLGRVPLDIEVADMNGDGRPDFVQTFVGDPANPFQVWLNDGYGGVSPGFSPASGGDTTLAVGRLR